MLDKRIKRKDQELSLGALLGKFLKTRFGCLVHLDGYQALGTLWREATPDRVEQATQH